MLGSWRVRAARYPFHDRENASLSLVICFQRRPPPLPLLPTPCSTTPLPS